MKKTFLIFTSILFFCCGSSNKLTIEKHNDSRKTYSILALGDSYTIGESVCETCRFPEQLKKHLENDNTIKLDIIAETGWTTSDLKLAITKKKPANNFDLVTLLIGVNNQYQKKPFALYKSEFPELVRTAIIKANNDKNKVIIISIPDYAFTPYGKKRTQISREINLYNAFAENYCKQNDISFINITDITRQGIIEPNLVANDGLHPSQIAYQKFVERLLPKAKEILK